MLLNFNVHRNQAGIWLNVGSRSVSLEVASESLHFVQRFRLQPQSYSMGHTWSHKGLEVKTKTLGISNGEGNGTPLQYSCLENPTVGEAWWAAVHGVAEGRTRLRDFTFTQWRRTRQPTPVFLPGEPQERGSLVGCRLWGCTESDMTEAT